MNNAINNQFKMKMGSKQKDTEGNFSEKDTALIKQAPLLNITNALRAQESIDAEKGDPFKELGDAFAAGAAEKSELASGEKSSNEYTDKFTKMGEEVAGEKKKGLGGLIGKAAGFLGLG